MKTNMLTLLAGVLLALPFTLSAGETPLKVGDKWSLTRIWKSAEKGKYHFYEGKLPFVNAGQKEVTNLTAVCSLRDVEGKEIGRSQLMNFGNVAPGKTVSKSFIIEKGLQFSELFILAEYQLEGKSEKKEFSSAGGNSRPEAVEAVSGVTELRLIGYTLDLPVGGKNKNKDKYSTLNVRVRNLAAVPATDARIRAVFTLSKKKKGVKGDANGIPGVKLIGGNKAEMNVLLDKNPIPAGAVKTYTLKVNAPEHEEVTVALSANWAAEETEEPAAPAAGGEVAGDDLAISAISAVPLKDGLSELRLTVTNRADAIAAGKLTLTIELQDADGKTLETIRHRLPGELAKGSKTDVVIPARKLPPYKGYAVSYEF